MDIDPDTLIRDFTNLNPDSVASLGYEAPKCFGFFEPGDEACEGNCPYLDSCIVNDLRSKVK